MTTTISLGMMAMAAGSSAALASSALCCGALSSQVSLQDKVHLPESTFYPERLAGWWSKSAALAPWCMVLPTSTEEVSLAIKTLGQNNCTFGIRSGGHGDFPLANSVADGVTLDLGHMNATNFNAETRIASIQPGSSWQPVYDTLQPHGVAVAGGRAGVVGVGGFVTGGGNSFFSASHGFGCDTVQNFEVVLGNGSVVNANEQTNSRLWRALKGGTSNFGVVTRFDMYAIDLPGVDTNIWGGVVTFDVGASDAVIDAYVKFADNVHTDLNSSEIFWWRRSPEGDTIQASLVNTLNDDSAAAFDEILAIDGVTFTSLRAATLANVTGELEVQLPGYHQIWYTSAYKNDASMLRWVVSEYRKLNDKLNTTLSHNTWKHAIYFQPITKSMVDRGSEKGGNVLGLEDRVANGDNGAMFLLTFENDDAEDEKLALSAIQDFMDTIDDYATENGHNWNWRFLNYAYKGQDPIGSYGSTVDEIRDVAKEYDPLGVFQTLRLSGHHIPPL